MFWEGGLVQDINCESDQKWTALLTATSNGHGKIVQYLLQQGADTERRTYQDLTALHLAAARGNLEIVQLLVERGANKDASGFYKCSALHLAVERGSADVVTFLLESGASPLLHDVNGNTPLTLACRSGSAELVFALVETLDRIDAIDLKRQLIEAQRFGGWTPLNLAADGGHFEIVVFLVEHGANLETKNDRGFSPLNSAAIRGHSDVVQFLLESGADTDSKNKQQNTPLLHASLPGHRDVVELLLEHGAQTECKNINGMTALLDAAMEGHADVVETLLHYKVDPDARTNEGWTPLLFAAERGNAMTTRMLAEHGANINVKSFDNWSPLTAASNHGHLDVCRFLLDCQASLSTQTTDGRSALHLAADRGHAAIIELLLERGADARAEDNKGHTPSWLAALAGHFDIVECLAAANAPPLESNNSLHDIWPLHTLRELYGQSFDTINTVETPTWFIDRSSVHTTTRSPHFSYGVARVHRGTWMGSNVLIIEPNVLLSRVPGSPLDEQTLRQALQREVSKWFPLNHPHVIKLFGAGHRGEQPFLVMEHPQDGALRSHVQDQSHRRWAILHEAALGLQYLHERGVIHGALTGNNILIGDDGRTKLSGLGIYSTSIGPTSAHASTFVWSAPEVIQGKKSTFESDVYSLAMCVIEAITGALPYAAEVAAKRDVNALILGGVLPKRPTGVCDRAWDLITRMAAFQPRTRPKISEVVSELEALAREEALASASSPSPMDRHDYKRSSTALFDSNDDDAIEEALGMAISLLPSDDDRVDRDSSLQRQAVDRLTEVWTKLELESSSEAHASRSALLQQYSNTLAHFLNDLQAQSSLSAAESFAAGRQHADRIYSLHNEIDRIAEQLGLLTHAWRPQWYEHRREQLQSFSESLPRASELDVEAQTCLLFELTTRRDAYSSIPPPLLTAACSQMRSSPGVDVPEWFVPHYEVAFDAFQSFSKGAFGSVHHGEWMGSRVVVKKVFADEHSAAATAGFRKEVEIWFQLYHPHVLRLFGACHVGQKFLVSEFAAHGQLDTYLHAQGRDRLRIVWQKLFEAALGLLYLHERGVVHCDLKCNNLLVGRDGKVKVTDFGLSLRRQLQEQQPDAPVIAAPSAESSKTPASGVGAPRWKAPEILNGADPTLESDVYSFAMCIIEAVSGEFPWGMHTKDELVSDHVKRGGALFPKPRGFTDAQWRLVERMSCFDPSQRMTLRDVVAALEQFARESVSWSDPELDAHEPEPDAPVRGDSAVFSDARLPTVHEMAQLRNLSDSLG